MVSKRHSIGLTPVAAHRIRARQGRSRRRPSLLGSVERLERALVLFMVVAWRVAHLMRLGRTCPDLDADLFFEPDEIRGAYLLTQVRQPARPKLNKVLRLIARLGGFLGRKSDGEPGVKSDLDSKRFMSLPKHCAGYELTVMPTLVYNRMRNILSGQSWGKLCTNLFRHVEQRPRCWLCCFTSECNFLWRRASTFNG